MFVLGMMSAAVALAVWAKPPEVGHRDAVLSLEGVGEVLEVAEGAGGGDLADRRIAFSQPIRDLVPCDDKWHPATVSFAAPTGACRGQVMLAMFRSNATIFIDDFKLYEGGSGDVPAARATAVSPAAGGKGEMLIRVKFDGEAPAVTGVEVVK